MYDKAKFNPQETARDIRNLQGTSGCQTIFDANGVCSTPEKAQAHVEMLRRQGLNEIADNLQKICSAYFKEVGVCSLKVA